MLFSGIIGLPSGQVTRHYCTDNKERSILPALNLVDQWQYLIYYTS